MCSARYEDCSIYAGSSFSACIVAWRRILGDAVGILNFEKRGAGNVPLRFLIRRNMFEFRAKNKQKIIDTKVDQLEQGLADDPLDRRLDRNLARLQELFCDVDILRLKPIQNRHNPSLKFCIAYCDGVVNAQIIDEYIIRALIESDVPLGGAHLVDILMQEVLQINEAEKTATMKRIIKCITYGDTVVFTEGARQAIILNTKSFITRSLAEPENERSLSGPREGFNESLMQNLSLIRRKVRTNELKMKILEMGRRTQTCVCVCYLNGLVNQDILNELFRRLKQIDIDAVLDSNYITEFIRDDKFSLIRTVGYTERPDIVIAKLLEGRIAVFVDGTPVVITVPYLFIENFQSGEDYYLSFYYTSFSRVLRMLGFFLTVTVPGLYVAIVAFHHEMIPTPLLINIAAERSTVPLPAAVEALVMLILFDILRETGIRMPSNIGQALSIVGALVIGQAAVAAKLIAAPMIIVVAITGITSLLVPKMNAPIIYLRLILLFLSSTFGLFGLMIGLSASMIHILNLNSMGVPLVSLNGNLRYQRVKDTFLRAPWWQMRLRPHLLTQDPVRLNQNKDENGGN